MDNNVDMNHLLTLENREHLTLTGISDVDSFNEEEINAISPCGELTIKGELLHIEELNLEAGTVSVSGKVTSLLYSEKFSSTTLLKRLLYDLMRFFRLSFGGSLFFDLLFWLITSFVSFSYLLIFNDGAIKGIFLAFIFVGFTVYIISMGKISLPLEKRIAKKVKIRLKKVKKSLENFKKVLQLPRMLYYNIKEIIKKPNCKKYEGDEFGKGKQEQV